MLGSKTFQDILISCDSYPILLFRPEQAGPQLIMVNKEQVFAWTWSSYSKIIILSHDNHHIIKWLWSSYHHKAEKTQATYALIWKHANHGEFEISEKSTLSQLWVDLSLLLKTKHFQFFWNKDKSENACHTHLLLLFTVYQHPVLQPKHAIHL